MRAVKTPLGDALACLVSRSDLRRPAWPAGLAGEESTELLDLLSRAQSTFPMPFDQIAPRQLVALFGDCPQSQRPILAHQDFGLGFRSLDDR
jgi:hypothetical protein